MSKAKINTQTTPPLQKGFFRGRVGTGKVDFRTKRKQDLLQMLRDIEDTYNQADARLSDSIYHAVLQLHRLTVKLQSGHEVPKGFSGTASAAAEIEISQCILECLPDAPAQKQDAVYVQSLLSDYKSVRFHPKRNPSVSLSTIHEILQDNFEDSSLRNLFDVLLGCSATIQSRTICL